MKRAVTDRRVQRYRDEKRKMQADRDIINSLMMGHTELTQALAGAIYYKIISNNIQFQSLLGEDFMKQVRHTLQDEGQNAVYLRIDYEKQKQYDRQLLARICKRTLLAVSASTILLCVVLCNWGTIRGWLDTAQAQKTKQEQTIEPEPAPAAAMQEEPTTAETEQAEETSAVTQKRSWTATQDGLMQEAGAELVTVTLQYGFATLAPNIEQLTVTVGSTLDLDAVHITVDGGTVEPLVENDVYEIDGVEYIFKGWYDEDVTQPKWDADADTVSEDTTLYATWERADGYFKK